MVLQYILSAEILALEPVHHFTGGGVVVQIDNL